MPTNQSGDIACLEADLNRQSLLQLQCCTGAEWAGIVPDVHVGKHTYVILFIQY